MKKLPGGGKCLTEESARWRLIIGDKQQKQTKGDNCVYTRIVLGELLVDEQKATMGR